MTERAPTTGLDFDELVRLVAREVDAGRRAVQSTWPHDGALQISGVRVRLGQRERPSQPTAQDGPPPFLLLDRYPPSHQGWQFEMEFITGTLPQARGADGGWVPVPGEPQITLADLYGHLPIDALKGASAAWASRLKKSGVSTIAELSSLSPENLKALVRGERSRHPIELQFKAWMLNIRLPSVPLSAADATPLSRLITKTPQELRSLVGETRFSALASQQLATILSLLFTVIDYRVLGGTTLGDLRASIDTI